MMANIDLLTYLLTYLGTFSSWGKTGPAGHQLSIFMLLGKITIDVWQDSKYASGYVILKLPDSTFTSSKSTIETLEEGVKYVES